jgi:hypothetical protein
MALGPLSWHRRPVGVPHPPLAPGNPTSTSGTGLMVSVGPVANPPGASLPLTVRDTQTEPRPESSDSWFSARPTWSLLAWLLVLGCAVAHSDGLPLPSFFAFGVMLCITLCTRTTPLNSPTSTTGSALRLIQRGSRYPALSRAPPVPLSNLLWSTLPCYLLLGRRTQRPLLVTLPAISRIAHTISRLLFRSTSRMTVTPVRKPETTMATAT